MTTYTVSTKAKQFTVETGTYNQAAQIAVRKITRRKRITAQRTTGDHNLSGWFQGYVSVRTGGMTSFGPSFHVS